MKDLEPCYRCGAEATLTTPLLNRPICKPCNDFAEEKLAIAIFGKKRVEMWKQQIAEKGEAA